MANSTTLYVGSEGRTQVDVTEAKTLTLADQGIVQNVINDLGVVTLPATSAGAVFIVRNGGLPASSGLGAASGASGGVLAAVSPNASDKIQGLAFTAADNKDALNTKATSQVGDQITLVGDGIDGYNIQSAKGVWAREA